MHIPLCSLPEAYAPLSVKSGVLVVSVFVSSPSLEHFTVPQEFYTRLCISMERYTISVALYLMVWEWRGLKALPMLLYFIKLLSPFLCYIIFNFSSFFLWVGFVGLGTADSRCQLLASGLILPTTFNISVYYYNNNNYYYFSEHNHILTTCTTY